MEKETIHIHDDVENLIYFTNKDGIPCFPERIVCYAMQNEHIVRVFYTFYSAKEWYEKNRFKENLPIIYYWNEERWNKKNNLHYGNKQLIQRM